MNISPTTTPRVYRVTSGDSICFVGPTTSNRWTATASFPADDGLITVPLGNAYRARRDAIADAFRRLQAEIDSRA